MVRRPADPEEELRWMSQEVRGYVEAVLNSLAANIPKVHNRNKAMTIFFLFVMLLIKCSFVVQAGCCALSSRKSKGGHAKSTLQLSKVGNR